METSCIHEPIVKIENGIIISLCRKCGAILGTSPVPVQFSCSTTTDGNAGVILHD